jgi:hypothetical protein
MTVGDNDNRPSPDDGVYEAMAELDAMPAPMDVTRAVLFLLVGLWWRDRS